VLKTIVDLADFAARLALVLAAAFLLALMPSGPALAHAEFRGSDPAANAVLERLPGIISLRFSEQVGVLTLSWLLPDGAEAPANAEAGADSLTIAPPTDVGRGTYVLRWRVASTDGHPVGGALVFSVGEVSGAAQGGTSADPSAVSVVVLRAAMVVALVLSVGASVFHTSIAPLAQRPLRMAAGLAVLVLPFGLMWLGAEGLDRLGQSLMALFQPDVWAAALEAPALFSVILAAVAAPLAFLALLAGFRSAAIAAWALVALSFAVSGHALSAPTRLALPLTFLHGAALLFWVGSLLPLGFAVMPLDAPKRAALLRRFSRPALITVIVLIGTGTGLILIRPLGALTLATPWVQLLGAKLALVAVMLGLAVWHKAWATPRLASGQDMPVRNTIRGEALLGLVVLCLAMGFRLAPPPAAPLVDTPSVHIHTAQAMATIELSAAPPGAVSLRVSLADGDFNLLEPQEVRLTLTDPVAGIGPLAVEVARAEPGLWITAPVTLPTQGPWEVRLMLLISDFEQVTLTGELQVKGPEKP
jgi:copper transport protein